MTIIRVGQDKEFLTIQGAFSSAINGDTIFIDEGTYEEALYFVNKAINLVANTDYPSEGKVIINPISYSTPTVKRYAMPLTIAYAESEPPRVMFIEGIKFVSDVNSNEETIIRLEQAEAGTTSSLDIVFNKCILDASAGLYNSGAVIFKELTTGYPVNSVTLINCEVLWLDGDDMVNSEFYLIPAKKLQKCVLSSHPPINTFGASFDLCVSGTITSSGTTNQENIFDGNESTYGAIGYDPIGWVGYQFSAPFAINQLKIKGDSSGHGSGFTLVASTTGAFLGEEVILNIDTIGMGYTWSTYIFENYNEYSYIRIYNTGDVRPWQVSEIEYRKIMPEDNDYILVDNKNNFQYGPLYSSFITAIQPSHCFSGIVSVNSTPVVRDLKLFRRDNGLFLGSTTSSGGTGEYYIESSFGGHHSIVCSDDAALPNYNDLLMSKCLPKEVPNLYVPVEHSPQSVKTFIMDMADNWSGATYISIRSIDFLFEGVVIPLEVAFNCESYSTTDYSDYYYSKYAFNTATLKTGAIIFQSWLSQNGLATNQRLICVFNESILVDKIRINNSHHNGTETSVGYGAKNTKIHISSIEYTDTTYNNPISQSIEVFDGIIPKHIAEDIEDPFDISI